MKGRFLIILAIFLVLIPWIRGLEFSMSNQVMVDGITVSAIVVMTITLVFSIVSWSLFSWASKNIKFPGFLLSVITGASLVIPFIQVLGPMAGIIVGIVAGFVAFMLQKKMTDPAGNKPLVIAVITLAVAYFALIMMILAAQSSSMENGIGEWTGTAEGMEKTGFENVISNSIGFVFFLAIIPALIITGLIILDKNEMKGKVLIMTGVTMMAVGFSAIFYSSFVLFSPAEPPMMRPIEGMDFVFFMYRQEFLFSGIIGTFVTLAGFIIRRKQCHGGMRDMRK